MTEIRTRKLSSNAHAVIKAAHELDWVNTKAVAAVLRTAAYRLSFGHATGSGVIDEDDLLLLANEIENADA